MNKKIIITGATGLIGKFLCSKLAMRGDKITILTRNIAIAKKIIPFAEEYVLWNEYKQKNYSSNFEEKDVIIHLAGANLAEKRWSESYKNEIIKSRELTTRNLVESLYQTKTKPKTFISISAIGYYGNTGEESVTEDFPNGNNFVSEVCRRWEKETEKVKMLNVRRVIIRSAVVLSKYGGALPKMIMPFKFFIGGKLGDGEQWFSWIHIQDLINIFLLAIDDENIKGEFNASSPNAIKMKDVAIAIGSHLNRPSIFTVPAFALKVILGEASYEILSSKRIYPKKLIDIDFKFQFPNFKEAIEDLV